MGSSRSAVARGAIGGVLAATAIVVFFFIVDLVRGEPLQTPAFLSGVLLGRPEVEGGVGLIAAYTLVHYAVFVAVGVALAWVFERVRLPVPILLGLVVGFLLFDLVFYAGVVVTGVDVIDVIGWPSFLVGNLLAGVVLVAYLGRGGSEPGRGWRATLEAHAIWREGLVAGLIGAVAVAAWFFLLDLVLGRLFFTPAALGSALFQGVDQLAMVQVTAGSVLGYTAFHVAAFLVTGLAFAAIVGQAEENPSFLLGLILLFVTFETLVIGLIAIVAAWLLDVIPWWSIATANLVAAASMGAYLWHRHPGLDRKLDRAEDPAVVDQSGPGAVTPR